MGACRGGGARRLGRPGAVHGTALDPAVGRVCAVLGDVSWARRVGDHGRPGLRALATPQSRWMGGATARLRDRTRRLRRAGASRWPCARWPVLPPRDCLGSHRGRLAPGPPSSRPRAGASLAARLPLLQSPQPAATARQHPPSARAHVAPGQGLCGPLGRCHGPAGGGPWPARRGRASWGPPEAGRRPAESVGAASSQGP